MVMAVPPDEAAKLAPADVDVRLTVVGFPAVARLPYASTCSTVIGPSVALLEALPETAAVVKSNLAGAPAVMTSCCVAEVRPVEVAVIVGVPGTSSP